MNTDLPYLRLLLNPALTVHECRRLIRLKRVLKSRPQEAKLLKPVPSQERRVYVPFAVSEA